MMMSIGEKVWNRLRAEGGFVWTVADGRKFVRFNRGCHPSAELQSILKRHREDLKAFVDVMHKADEVMGAPGVGSSRPIGTPAPNGRGGDMRDCHADSRSAVSPKTAKNEPSARTAVKVAAISAAAAILAGVFAAGGEIWVARTASPGGSVGLVTVLSTIYSPGSGEGATTNGGYASWRRN